MSFARKLKPLDRPVFHLIFIALLGLIAYSNTFDVPFQWDDKYYISQNPLIQELTYFTDMEEASQFKLYNAFKNRYIGYLTFALNYKLHGLDVRGYHVVNIVIHILNAFLVYFLVILTVRTPFLTPPSPPWQGEVKGGLIALFSALIFVSHPIQTEAVTYIFQRLASLAAFFYMLSLVFYIKWRIYEPQRHGDTEKEGKNLLSSLCLRASVVKFSFYMLSLVSAILAMKTKENAFTLPIMIALYEFSFFKGKIKRRIVYLAPLLLTMLIIPLSFSGGIASAMKGYEGISKLDYLFTQFRVIVTYLRLLVLPINQNVDYDYSIYQSLFAPQVLFSFLFLMSLIGLGVYLSRRSKNKAEMRLISFGIFWFFIALAVESSIIPIPMLINEYRLYLPSIGIIIAASTAFMLLFSRLSRKPFLLYFLLLGFLTVILSSATYARNNVWRDEFAFWEDAMRKSPNRPSAYAQLGSLYGSKGDMEKALYFSERAIELNPSDAIAYNNIGLAYYRINAYEPAYENLKKAIELDSTYEVARYNLGLVYEELGQKELAVESYQEALRIRPGWELPLAEIERLQMQNKEGEG